MNDLICNLLCPLGVTANYIGYYYTIYAVELAATDPSHLMQVTKDLYPAIADHFSSTVSCVERNLRTSVSLAWRTNPELLERMAGHLLYRRPHASQFIAILTAEYKKLLVREEPSGQQCFF